MISYSQSARFLKRLSLVFILATLIVAVSLMLLYLTVYAGRKGKGANGCGTLEEAVEGDGITPPAADGDIILAMLVSTGNDGATGITRNIKIEGSWTQVDPDESCPGGVIFNDDSYLQVFTLTNPIQRSQVRDGIDQSLITIAPRVDKTQSITLEHLTFENFGDFGNNPATGGAISGNIANAAQIQMENVRFQDITVTGNGGALNLEVRGGSRLVISNSEIVQNTAEDSGGGFEFRVLTNSKVILDGLEVLTNTASGSGGGGRLFLFSGSQVTITNSIFRGNRSSGNGAGFYAELRGGSRLVISDSQFISNLAQSTGSGGAFEIQLFENSQLLLQNVQVSTNSTSAGDGSGGRILIQNSGFVTVTNSSFFGNQTNGTTNSNGFGGGLVVTSPNNGPASIWVNDNFFGSNRSSNDGGGLHLTGRGLTAYINDNLFVNNRSTNHDGGGLYIGNSVSPISQIWLGRNRFEGNEAEKYGGGLNVEGLGAFAYGQNNLFVSNIIDQTSSSGGGGIVAQVNSTYNGYNDTIFNNDEEGVYNLNSTLVLSNAILWGNNNNGLQTGGGSPISISYSDVQGGHTGPGSENININPEFDPVSQPAAYLPEEPALINKGTSVGAPLDDFRGLARVKKPDMGAFENLNLQNIGGLDVFLPILVKN